MNLILNEKEAAFKVMQNEFTVIKDFRVSDTKMRVNEMHQLFKLDHTKYYFY